MLRWVLLALLIGSCASAGEEKKKKQKTESLARGWGDSIKWVKTYKEALQMTVKSKKPLMVIHHKLDCPHSKALKKAFVAAKSIQKMAKEDFIMLNTVTETGDKNLAPDGYYVPRIIFVDPSKTVRTDIRGRYSNHRYTYQAADLPLLAKNMETAKVLLHPEL